LLYVLPENRRLQDAIITNPLKNGLMPVKEIHPMGKGEKKAPGGISPPGAMMLLL